MGYRRLVRFVVLVMTLLIVLAPAARADVGDPGTETVSLSLSASQVDFGQQVVATGSVQPAVWGEDVVLEVRSGGFWTQPARATTDALGSFSVSFVPELGGEVVARALGSGAASAPVALAVRPRVRVSVRKGTAFLGAKLTARIAPASYSGRVAIAVKSGGRTLATVSARAAGGRLRATVPTPGVGRFTVVVTFPTSQGLTGLSVGARMSVRARTLAAGSSGRDVRALTQRLAQLHIRIPGISSTFSPELIDSIYALQKAYGLPRTGVVGPQTWRMLGRAQLLRPRYRGPSPHIEIDKTRQILLLVRGGAVAAVLPVSSGATGNTPEGKHHIRWKALATTTWLGSAILYRTMTFYGNSFAIHGYYSVPPYPASHGCVRIPIWTADWLYDQSYVGETVYVYR